MSTGTADLLLERLFIARGITLKAGAICLALIIALFVDEYLSLLTDRGKLLLGLAFCAVLLVILMGSLLTWIYMFRVGLDKVGFGYAVGHTILCIFLTYMGLIGIIVMPLLMRNDIQRRQRVDGDLPDADAIV